MERQIVWERTDGVGLEHLRVEYGPDGALADGLVIGLRDGFPYRAHYQIQCDRGWRVRRVVIRHPDRSGGGLVLVSDGAGLWTGVDGVPRPDLDGCTDVDISATPFTNTIAIRRLNLEVHDSADIQVVYVTVPDLEAEAVDQRYTCIERDAAGGRYLYEGIFRGFTGELPVDADGLVIDYPRTFRRVWPRAAW